MKQENRKKINIAKKIFIWVTGILVVVTMISAFLSMMVVDKNDSKEVFGYQMYVILSDSMKDTFEAGDIIISKKVDVQTLKEGDIITFKSTSSASYGEIVTHKIRKINKDGSNLSFTTYGTTTGADDEMPALAKNVAGKYQGKIPKVGYFFEYLKTPPGYTLLILFPIGILLLLQGAQCIKLFKKYKLEKAEEISLEKAKSDEMALQLKKLTEELDAIKKEKNN